MQLRAFPGDVIAAARRTATEVLAELGGKSAGAKKVHDSYMGFKKGWDKWAGISEGVYHSQIRGQI